METRKFSLKELAAKAREVHYVEIDYQGDTFAFPWKELSDTEQVNFEMMAEGLSKQEEMDQMNAAMAKVAFKMIVKGAAEAEGVEVSEQAWNELPKRLRMQLVNSIFDIRLKEKKDFLPAPRPTQTQ